MVYNVKDFGAKGNGRTDDKKAIQEAIDTAWENGGGTVYIPEGTYIVTGGNKASKGAILLRDNVTLEGAGMGETIVQLADGWDKKLTGIIRTPSAEVNHDIVLRDLTIDGNMQNNRGEVDGFFTGVTPEVAKTDQNILVERVEIHSVSRYGFDPHEQTVGLTIRDSVSHHNGKDGFTIDYQSHTLLENNISYANGRHGFNIVTSSHDIDLKGNIAYGNAANGLTIQRGSEDRALTDDIIVEGGQFYGNGKVGILVKISTDVSINGVEVFDNQRQGIRVDGSDNVLIKNSHIHHNSLEGEGRYDGIEIQGYNDTQGASGKYFSSNNVVVQGNTVDGTGSGYAISEDYGAFGTSIEGNLLTAGKYGDLRLIGGAVVDWDGVFSMLQDLNGGAAELDTFYYDKGTYGYHAAEPTVVAEEEPVVTEEVVTEEIIIENGIITEDVIVEETPVIEMVYDLLHTGAESGDMMAGSTLMDMMLGEGGDDTIRSGAGDDYVIGGTGNDSVNASYGNDLVEGNAGDDNLLGHDGNDTLLGGDGADRLLGHTGDDLLLGHDGDDIFNGHGGNDTLIGGNGNDHLWSGGGADLFVFDSEEAGVDYVKDFESGMDIIDLTDFEHTNTSTLDMTQQGEHVLLNLDGDSSIIFQNTLLSELGNDSFLF